MSSGDIQVCNWVVVFETADRLTKLSARVAGSRPDDQDEHLARRWAGAICTMSSRARLQVVALLGTWCMKGDRLSILKRFSHKQSIEDCSSKSTAQHRLHDFLLFRI